jgi:hypothetical protein
VLKSLFSCINRAGRRAEKRPVPCQRYGSTAVIGGPGSGKTSRGCVPVLTDFLRDNAGAPGWVCTRPNDAPVLPALRESSAFSVEVIPVDYQGMRRILLWEARHAHALASLWAEILCSDEDLARREIARQYLLTALTIYHYGRDRAGLDAFWFLMNPSAPPSGTVLPSPLAAAWASLIKIKKNSPWISTAIYAVMGSAVPIPCLGPEIVAFPNALPIYDAAQFWRQGQIIVTTSSDFGIQARFLCAVWEVHWHDFLSARITPHSQEPQRAFRASLYGDAHKALSSHEVETLRHAQHLRYWHLIETLHSTTPGGGRLPLPGPHWLFFRSSEEHASTLAKELAAKITPSPKKEVVYRRVKTIVASMIDATMAKSVAEFEDGECLEIDLSHHLLVRYSRKLPGARAA